MNNFVPSKVIYFANDVLSVDFHNFPKEYIFFTNGSVFYYYFRFYIAYRYTYFRKKYKLPFINIFLIFILIYVIKFDILNGQSYCVFCSIFRFLVSVVSLFDVDRPSCSIFKYNFFNIQFFSLILSYCSTQSYGVQLVFNKKKIICGKILKK